MSGTISIDLEERLARMSLRLEKFFAFFVGPELNAIASGLAAEGYETFTHQNFENIDEEWPPEPPRDALFIDKNALLVVHQSEMLEAFSEMLSKWVAHFETRKYLNLRVFLIGHAQFDDFSQIRTLLANHVVDWQSKPGLPETTIERLKTASLRTSLFRQIKGLLPYFQAKPKHVHNHQLTRLHDWRKRKLDRLWDLPLFRQVVHPQKKPVLNEDARNYLRWLNIRISLMEPEIQDLLGLQPENLTTIMEKATLGDQDEIGLLRHWAACLALILQNTADMTANDERELKEFLEEVARDFLCAKE